MTEFVLVLLGEGGAPRARYPLATKGVQAIGRSSDCEIVVPGADRKCSGRHALIEVIGDAVFVVDQSQNGSFIDGERVTSNRLKVGSVLRVGGTSFRLEEESATEVVEEVESIVSLSLLEDLKSGRVPPPPPRRGSASPPLRWREFDLVELLGRGGFGSVYLARHRETGALCALKLIHPERTGSEEAARRFVREQEVLSSLRHPNIVFYVTSGEFNGVPFLATEYVPGGTLESLEPCQDLGQYQRIARGMWSALAYMHERRAIHRDIKPANVLLTLPDERGLRDPKLADLGFGKSFDGGLKTALVPSLTQSGTVGGTLRWSSPEQVHDFRKFSPAGDLYSAAATLYTLLTGESHLEHERSLEKMNVIEQYQLVIGARRIPLRTRRPDVDAREAEALDRLLAIDFGYRSEATAAALGRLWG